MGRNLLLHSPVSILIARSSRIPCRGLDNLAAGPFLPSSHERIRIVREHRADVARFSLFLTVPPYLLFHFFPRITFFRFRVAQLCFVYPCLPTFFLFLSFLSPRLPPPLLCSFLVEIWRHKSEGLQSIERSGDCSLFWVLRDGEKLCIGRRYRKMKRCSCIIQTPFSHSPLPCQVTTTFDDTCRCSCGFSPADLSFGLTVKFYTPRAREEEGARPLSMIAY